MVRRWNRFGLAVVATLVAVFAAMPAAEAAPRATAATDPLFYCTLAAGNARTISFSFAQQTTPTGTIEVANQPLVNGAITVAKATISQDGWIAVHEAGDDGQLQLTPLAGIAPIKAGDTVNIVIQLNAEVEAGDTLWPMLHIDAGTLGTYEFPNGPDVPVVANGAPVMQQITVQAAGAPAPAPAPTSAPAPAPAPPVQATPTGTIEVANQAIVNRTITVAKATISQDGWIAVHKAGPDGKLLLTPLAGIAPIKAGDNMNVVVPLVEDVAVGASLWPMLHIDAGTLGTYEFPDGPDVPVVANGMPVMQQITVQEYAAPAPAPGPAAATGSIQVANQPVVNRTITVAKATISQDGWIAVHKAGPDGKLLLTPLAGIAPIKAGDNTNVVIQLTEDVAPGASLWPMLHIDAGTLGTYEFPNGPDVPVVANGMPVMQQITVQGPTTPVQLPTTGETDGPVNPSALLVAALALLAGGALVVRRSWRRGNA